MKRLRNTTDIPDALVREIEALVMPPGGVGAYDLELRNTTRGAGGRAYWKGSGYHSTARPFIVVRIGPEQWRKAIKPANPGYLPMPAVTRLEAFVVVFAHELRHLWQARVKHGRRVWGSRGQFSERDADAYALNRLRAWRKSR